MFGECHRRKFGCGQVIFFDEALKRNLLYFCPAVDGGIADYGRAQAQALVQAGVEVFLVTTPRFKPRPDDGYQWRPTLLEKPVIAKDPLMRVRSRMRTANQILSHLRDLVAAMTETNCSHVLLSAYAEYLAPLWAPSLRRLARNGKIFGAIVHDPVRHAVIGPQWWHRWSMAEGYSFLREAFVHEPVVLDTVRPQPQLRTTVIPHGIFAVTAATKSPENKRRELNLPLDAKVLLSFGHVKDYKNLDLAIRALAQLPDFHLVVAGSPALAREKPVKFYQDLAFKIGVAERCRWCVQHIPENEVGDFFGLADLVLLTYSRAFRSASGVLNVAAAYRKPCIASSGESNLHTVIKNYGLGVWVEPDSETTLIAGIREWQQHPLNPAWQRYEQENSWAKNAEIVIRCMFQ